MLELLSKITKSRTFTYLVLALSIVFIFVGTYYGDEHLIVLQKAVRICMECIGIG